MDFIKKVFWRTGQPLSPSLEKPDVSIDDLRSILIKKLPSNRQEIKKWLGDRGFSNLTSMSSENYYEFYVFLGELK